MEKNITAFIQFTYIIYKYICELYASCDIYIHIQGVPKKCIHNLRDVIYVLLFEVELNYGSNV